MLTKFARAFASIVAFALAACATRPPPLPEPSKLTPAGDWTANLVTPQLTYRLGVHIDETAPGQFAGTIDSPDTGRWDTPLEALAFTDDTLTFKIPTSNATFQGRWDPAASAWTGDYVTGAQTYPITFTAGVLPPLPTVAGLDGRWEGPLDVGGRKLRIVVRVESGEHGTGAFIDSPDQGASGITITGLTRDASHVAFDVPSLRGRYEGDLAADGQSLSGQWSQGGDAIPLAFVRTPLDTKPSPPVRPQTPRKPYPYREEEVAFDNPAAPGVRLSCSLTLPPGAGPHPAAVLITGSGPQDRDETVFGHKPFLVLADHLTRKGVAILRCDDRGTGKSTGSFATSVISDFASDAEASFDYLRARADIDPRRIGLIGHSEGGATGPMVAARRPEVAFLVMLAGAGAKGDEILAEQLSLLARAMGVSEDLITANRLVQRRVMDAALSAPDEATARAAVKAILLEAGAAAGVTDDASADAQAAQISSPYMRSLLSYDPAPVLPRIKAPVLALNGSKDLQVSASQNLPGLRTLLAGNPDVTIIELPGLNHLFQTAKTGAPSEYGEIEETFAPAALTVVSDWIVARTKP